MIILLNLELKINIIVKFRRTHKEIKRNWYNLPHPTRHNCEISGTGNTSQLHFIQRQIILYLKQSKDIY